jgi:phosphate transport system protein
MNTYQFASTPPEPQSGGARQRLDDLLYNLDVRLITLVRDIAERVVPTTNAFLEADEHAASSLKKSDDVVAVRCTELEEAGYLLLAMQSPVATDLRHTIAVLRSANNIQRSSNLLTHIVESLAWVRPQSLPPQVCETIRQLGTVAADMFERAAVGWEHHDVHAARELEHRDDEVDQLQRELISQLNAGTQSTEESISLGLMARYYERIADHAVAVARHLAYYLNGQSSNRTRSPAESDTD